VATGSKATTSSHIEEIQELAQQEGLKVPTTGVPHEGATAEIGEPSSPSGLSKDLPFLGPQLGRRMKICHILPFFIIITDINVMVVESTGVAQVEDPMECLGAEDSAVQTSAGEPNVLEFVAASLLWRLPQQPSQRCWPQPQHQKSLLSASSLHKLSQLPFLWMLLVLS